MLYFVKYITSRIRKHFYLVDYNLETKRLARTRQEVTTVEVRN